MGPGIGTFSRKASSRLWTLQATLGQGSVSYTGRQRTVHFKRGLWLRRHLHFSLVASWARGLAIPAPPLNTRSWLTHGSFVRLQTLAPGSHLLIS